jgi:metal-sulfur cluster biosynthetic enzyme
MTPLTREAVLERLAEVPEPCSILMGGAMNIRQMGLIEGVEIREGQVCVELVLTDASCPHFQGMRRYITEVLMELDGIAGVEVTISTRTLWTPDRVRRQPLSSG